MDYFDLICCISWIENSNARKWRSRQRFWIDASIGVSIIVDVEQYVWAGLRRAHQRPRDTSWGAEADHRRAARYPQPRQQHFGRVTLADVHQSCAVSPLQPWSWICLCVVDDIDSQYDAAIFQSQSLPQSQSWSFLSFVYKVFIHF